MSPSLSSRGSLRDRFERDGVVVIPDLVTVEDCDRLARRAAELVAATAPPDRLSVFTTDDQTRTSDEYFLSSGGTIRPFFEPDALDDKGALIVGLDDAVNKLGHALHDLDDVFDDFSRSPAVASVARDLDIGHHVLLQSMFIFKSPRVGGEVTAHTDDTFLWTDPASCVGFWFAIDDATVDNGALWAAPGAHRQPLRRRFHRAGPTDADGTTVEVLDETPLPTDALVPLEARKGTLIVLDGRLPHLSHANRSEKPRRAYTVHTIDPAARYPSDNWLQRGALPLRGFG